MDSSQKISRSPPCPAYARKLRGLIGVLVVITTPWIGGCGDSKTTATESQSILKDLRKIDTSPEPNIPMPSVYKQPPKIKRQVVAGAPEFKLFYFCQHLSAPELEAIVHQQFATLVFNAKGKSTAVKDYTVSSVLATNQLIVRCPTREDADAVLELLQQVDIPPIQVKIECIISEIYADKTLDWETTLQIENLLGENIWAGASGRPFGEGVMELVEDGVTMAAFPGASLREVARSRMGLKVGYQRSGFLSLVDVLESRGYLKILMSPTLEVVNGKTAKISQTQRVPVDKTFLHSAQSEFFTTKTEWVDVVDSLEITPHVFADGYIGLETSITLGSKLTPEGIKQIAIVTKKEIENEENRIRPGESLIIGGLRKSERRDVIRGIPFLKDLPLLGILFSGRDFEERAVETVFILTPTISTGGIPKKEMMKEIQEKQTPASSKGKANTNPLDILDIKKEQEAKKAEARAAIREAEEQTKRAKAEVEQATTKAETAIAAEQQAKAEAEQAKADAKTATEKATAAEKQAQTEIAKLKAEAEKLKAEAEIAKAEVQKATAEAEKAKADAEKAKTEADAKAKEDAAEEAKEETEQAKTE